MAAETATGEEAATPLLDALADKFNDSSVAVFTGAGFATAAPSCLPSWWALNHTVLDSLSNSAKEVIGDELAGRIVTAIKTSEEEGKFPPEYCAECIADLVDNYFDVLRCLEGETPNRNHLYLVALAKARKLRVIITTNFDTLQEKAFKEMGVDVKVCVQPSDYEDVDVVLSDPQGPCVLLKIHGTASDPKSCIDTLAQRRQGLHPSVNSVLDWVEERYAMLFVGWSGADLGGDENYLGLYSHRKQTPGYYFVNLPGTQPVSAVSELISTAIRGGIIDGRVPEWFDEFFKTMDDRPEPRKESEEEITRIKDMRLRELQVKTQAWTDGHGPPKCSLILADLSMTVDQPQLAKEALEALEANPGSWSLTSYGMALACKGMGDVHSHFNNYVEALDYYSRAADYFMAANDEVKEEGYHASLIGKANCYKSMSNYEGATKVLNESLAYFRSIGDMEGVMSVQLSLADCKKGSADPHSAIEIYKQIVVTAEKEGRARRAATALLGWASVAIDTTDPKDARVAMESAEKLVKHIGNKDQHAHCLVIKAQLCSIEGKTEESMSALDKALEIARTSNTARELIILEIKAALLTKNGHPEIAHKVLQEARDVALSDRNKLELTYYESRIYLASGNFPKVVEQLEPAIPEIESLGFLNLVCMMKQDLGIAYDMLDQGERALVLFNDALECAEAAGNKKVEAQLKANIGNVHFKMGEYDVAEKAYLTARATLIELGDKDGQTRTCDSLANVLAAKGDKNGALELYEQGIACADETENIAAKFYISRNYSACLYSLQRWKEAADAYAVMSSLALQMSNMEAAAQAEFYRGHALKCNEEEEQCMHAFAAAASYYIQAEKSDCDEAKASAQIAEYYSNKLDITLTVPDVEPSSNETSREPSSVELVLNEEPSARRPSKVHRAQPNRFTVTGVVLQGVLVKAPPLSKLTQVSLRRWRERWFVLHELPFPMLEYWKDESLNKSKGAIDLRTVVEIRSGLKHKSHPYVFSLVSSDREYFVAGDNEGIVEVWVNKLRTVVENHQRRRAKAKERKEKEKQQQEQLQPPVNPALAQPPSV